MAVTDPDCPFHLVYRMGTAIIGAVERMPVPVMYDPVHDVAVVSPGYERVDYEDAADWLMSVAAERDRASA